MKYSYTWLKELSGSKLSPDKLADLLMMRAFELEEMKKEGAEVQLVFDVLANRGHDALSHFGISREICAVEGRKFTRVIASADAFPGNDKLKIDIKDKMLCRRYIGAVLDNIEVRPSPKWMQVRLLVSGVKPINNVVDITNYVMLETGQPLHAFDKKKTAGNVIVRKAKKNEKIKLLDEKEYILTENDLVIADSEKALALAGVMGGCCSSITNKTDSIILESANFDPVNIRKTRVRHGLSTESSYRFERDIDPNLAKSAALRAIELLRQFGGKNVKITASDDVYPKKIIPWKIKLELSYVDKLLGEKIPASKTKNILERLGMKVKSGAKYFDVEIPTIRIDLKTQEDLIEEVGRIYGYENIPAKAPKIELSSPVANEKRIFEDKLREIMTALGFSEMLNYSFYGADDVEKCKLATESHFEVSNPMNPDQQYMRTTLVPGILKNVELNLKNYNEFSLFEIGRVYIKSKASVPDEKTELCAAIIDPTSKNNLFFRLKGITDALLTNLGVRNAQYGFLEKNYLFHPTRAAKMRFGKISFGKIGEINPQLAAKYGIRDRVAVLSINIEDLMKLMDKTKEYKSISKFPSVKRDISMFVGEKTSYAEIEKKVRESGGKLVLSVELFDVFEKEGEKSLALRIEIGSSENTLTSAKIDEVMRKIVSKLEKDLKVRVRK